MSAHEWFKHLTDENGITHIVLNRKPVNALTPDVLHAFGDLIRDLEDNKGTRAIVLSSGFKVFSAGVDLKEAQAFDLEQQYALVTGLNEAFLALYAFGKPVVAAVNGPALAGGAFFVLSSDYRVAGPWARFGLPEVLVGVELPVGPMEIARAELAAPALRRLMLGGQPIGAEQGLAAGIFDILTEPEDVLDEATRAAMELAANPSIAYGRSKQNIRQPAIDRIRAGIAAGGNTPEGGWFNAQTRAAMARMVG